MSAVCPRCRSADVTALLGDEYLCLDCGAKVKFVAATTAPAPAPKKRRTKNASADA